MHISDIIRGDSPTFSFEFFPPKTPAAAESLYQTIRELEEYMPHFVSVTYGAGGSTRDLTPDVATVSAQAAEPIDPLGTRADVTLVDRIEVGLGSIAIGIENARRATLDDHDLACDKSCCRGQPEQRPSGGICTVRATEHDDPSMPCHGQQT